MNPNKIKKENSSIFNRVSLKILFFPLLFLYAKTTSAQAVSNDIQKLLSKRFQSISTVAPFLNIAPDSRSSGMGDVGVATSPDAYSMFWNPAKLAYLATGRDIQLGISYTPWLSNITDGIYLLSLSGYKKLNNRSTSAASIRYFSMGQLDFTEQNPDGNIVPYKRINPFEFSMSGYYSLKLDKLYSIGVGLRFLYSDITNGVEIDGLKTNPGMSVGLDLSGYYTSEVIKSLGPPAILSVGAVISNIGPKISYSTQESGNNFLPTNFRVGSSWRMKFDTQHELTVALDLNKLLVPTPPLYKIDPETGVIQRDENGSAVIDQGKDPNVNVIQGVFQSFFDAPGGFTEELSEFNVGMGAEYIFADIFAFRSGFQFGAQDKGNKTFLTMGLGMDLRKYAIDLSYLLPVGDAQSPLQNTLRISFQYDIFGYIRSLRMLGSKSSRR